MQTDFSLKDSKMTEYANFRQRIDAVLRTLKVQQVCDFMEVEKQWSAGKLADPNSQCG